MNAGFHKFYRRYFPGLEGLAVEVFLLAFPARKVHREFEYAYFERGRDETSGVLYPTHRHAGLFSCLCTVLWALAELRQSGLISYSIDNRDSMYCFKGSPADSTWNQLFLEPRPEDVLEFKKNHPRIVLFSPHENYSSLVNDRLGVEWLNACFETYFAPSREVSYMAKQFVDRYDLSRVPTLAVYYRGTDKKTEVEPTPLNVYFQYVDSWLEHNPIGEVLIQTDQTQVKDEFVSRYRNRCKFIEELPTTSGEIAMHGLEEIRDISSRFAQLMCAMWLAVSECESLLTCTGNVGMFIAMRMLINRKSVVQLS